MSTSSIEVLEIDLSADETEYMSESWVCPGLKLQEKTRRTISSHPDHQDDGPLEKMDAIPSCSSDKGQPSTTRDAKDSTTAKASKASDIHLPVHLDLCWRCGYPGHRRNHCTGKPLMFCSRCGNVGIMSCHCPCGSVPSSSSNRTTNANAASEVLRRIHQFSPAAQKSRSRETYRRTARSVARRENRSHLPYRPRSLSRSRGDTCRCKRTQSRGVQTYLVPVKQGKDVGTQTDLLMCCDIAGMCWGPP